MDTETEKALSDIEGSGLFSDEIETIRNYIESSEYSVEQEKKNYFDIAMEAKDAIEEIDNLLYKARTELSEPIETINKISED